MWYGKTCKRRRKANEFVQATRLRLRKKADETKNESCSRKKNLVWMAAMNHHWPLLWSPHHHVPMGSDYSLSSIPFILESTGKVQRNFIHPGNILELIDFFFTLFARLELNIFLIHCSWIKWLLKVIHIVISTCAFTHTHNKNETENDWCSSF